MLSLLPVPGVVRIEALRTRLSRGVVNTPLRIRPDQIRQTSPKRLSSAHAGGGPNFSVSDGQVIYPVVVAVYQYLKGVSESTFLFKFLYFFLAYRRSFRGFLLVPRKF
ncbi:hypothetical protein EBT16_13895, partial [bacterium]|nr:hypothetical protein [bacterium]